MYEGVAVALAHGYAKAAGEPMAVLLHDLVGLQNGAMGVFNAWVDQVPMLVLGGSGPADAARRRPWIDWIHATRSHSLVVRDFVKWDDEPISLDAMTSSLVRAHRLAMTSPEGPTFVAMDALLQEEPAPDTQFEHLLAPAAQPAHGAAAGPRAPGRHDRRRRATGDPRRLRRPLRGRVPGSLTRWPTPPPLRWSTSVRGTTSRRITGPTAPTTTRRCCATPIWSSRSTSATSGGPCRRSTSRRHGRRDLMPAGTPIVGISLTELMHRGFNDRESVVGAERCCSPTRRWPCPSSPSSWRSGR